MKNKILFFLAACLGLALFFVALPRSRCCESESESDLNHDKLIGMAINGDIKSIESLYDEAVVHKYIEGQLLWARQGALTGSTRLELSYINIYCQMSRNDKKIEDKILLKNMHNPRGAGIAKKISVKCA